MLTFCMLGNFATFCCHLLSFSKLPFFKKNSFTNTIRGSNGLDPDHDLILIQTVSKAYQQMVQVGEGLSWVLNL